MLNLRQSLAEGCFRWAPTGHCDERMSRELALRYLEVLGIIMLVDGLAVLDESLSLGDRAPSSRMW